VGVAGEKRGGMFPKIETPALFVVETLCVIMCHP